MTIVTFDVAFERLLGHEGVLSMDPNDKGNWTAGAIGKGELRGSKYGISAAQYPELDIAGLTVEQARTIYARDYWVPVGCDRVPDGLAFDLFDMAVNSGPRAAIRTLQLAAGVEVDGILGPHTIQAVKFLNVLAVLARFNGARLLFMTDASGWTTQGRGWAKRVARNLMEIS